MPHTLKQEAFVITIEKTWFQYTKVHDTLCVVQMSMSYCCCHWFYHNSQLRNTHSGAAQNENSKSGIVGGNAELALRRCLIFDQTICYSAQAGTSLLKPRVCLHCLQDRSSPDLCIIFGSTCTLFWRCAQTWWSLGVDFSHQPALLLSVSHWRAGQVPWAQTEMPEIPSEHKKTLSLWALLNTGSSCPAGQWSLHPRSQFKLDGTQSRATCCDWPCRSREWPGRSGGVVHHLCDWACDSTMCSVTCGSRSWP